MLLFASLLTNSFGIAAPPALLSFASLLMNFLLCRIPSGDAFIRASGMGISLFPAMRSTTFAKCSLVTRIAARGVIFWLVWSIFTIPLIAHGSGLRCKNLFSSEISPAPIRTELKPISDLYDQCTFPTCWIHASTKEAEYRIKSDIGVSIPLNFKFIYAISLLQKTLDRIADPYSYVLKAPLPALDGGDKEMFEKLVSKFGLLPASVVSNDIRIDWARLEKRVGKQLKDIYSAFYNNQEAKYYGTVRRVDFGPIQQAVLKKTIAIFKSELGPLANYVLATIISDPVKRSRFQFFTRKPQGPNFIVGGVEYRSPQDFAKQTFGDKIPLSVYMSVDGATILRESSNEDYPSRLWLSEKEFMTLIQWAHMQQLAPILILEKYDLYKDSSIKPSSQYQSGQHATIAKALDLTGPTIIELENSWKDFETLYIRGEQNLRVIESLKLHLTPEQFDVIKARFIQK